jgi:undecaprenyl-phosphate 4-deoxy-4-formamido-L-arabinose transferase
MVRPADSVAVRDVGFRRRSKKRMTAGPATYRPTLSIVVPLYNSATELRRLVDEIFKLQVPGGLELILVNDGSSDDTAEVCARLIAERTEQITFVNLSRNFGEHNAVMAGLRHVSGSYAVNLDDDLQNPPGEALKLLAHAQAHGLDVVYSRFKTKQHSAWRNLGSWITNRVADFLLDKPRGLYLSSFRCMSAFAVSQITQYGGPFPYIDGLLLQVTAKVGAIQVEHAPRISGHSGYSVRRLGRLWLNMFINFSVMPLRASTVFGLLMSSLGFIFTVMVVIENLTVGTPLGWSSLMSVLLVFSGTQLLVIGVMGEYLGRLYLTTMQRPQSVVREVVKSRGDAAP